MGHPDIWVALITANVPKAVSFRDSLLQAKACFREDLKFSFESHGWDLNLAIKELGTKVLTMCLCSTLSAESHQSLTMAVKGGDQALIIRSWDNRNCEHRATWLAGSRGWGESQRWQW